MRYLKYFILSILFSCSSSLLAHTYQGVLEVLIFDDFDNNKTTTLYKLHEAGNTYILNLPDSIDKSNLLSNKNVIAEGREDEENKEKTIKVESLILEENQNNVSKWFPYDIRRQVTFLVNFNNKKATSTVSISNVDSILYTSLQSSRRNLLRSSFKKVNLLTDPNADGRSDIFIVNLNYKAKGCKYEQWANDVRTAAAKEGVNLSLYKHNMFVLPKNVWCDWGGLAQLGCGTYCKSWVKAYDPTKVYSQLIYSHEIGHNLGMHHSATDKNNDGHKESEYGDAACIMGAGDHQYYKEVNAPHRDQMHWFDNYPDRIAQVTSGSYILNPLELGAYLPGLVTLKVKKNATETYYVSYRRHRGLFGAGAPDYLDKISIHRTREGDMHTYFIKSLKGGETFVDKANNIKITAVMTGHSTAMVIVN